MNKKERLALWTPEERKWIDEAIEEQCEKAWARDHKHDSLRAGRDWKEIQKWLKSKKSDRSHSIYKDSVKRLRKTVAYYIETGWIEREEYDASN